MTDVIIIGAGPAGLTAALYVSRAGHSVLVLEKSISGGQAVNTPHVENWPGIVAISGPDFAMNLVEQAKRFQIPIKFEEAVGIVEEKGYKVVETAANKYECRTVILANGLKRRVLEVPGEQEFAGRGVSYCAICDGNFFKGKAVAVIGGGNTAMEDAVYLASVCEKVYLVNRSERFRAEEYLVERAETRPNLHFWLGYTVERISGGDSVTAIVLKGAEGSRTIAVSGVFIAVGYEPQNTVFAPKILLNSEGFIQANEDCTTNVPGVFAAGDCRAKEFRQLVTAAADGAIAAGKAGQFLLSGRKENKLMGQYLKGKTFMKAIIDKSGCIGCGLCAATCPEVFDMGDDGLAEVISDPTEETAEAAKEAADGCPVAVITVEE